MRTCLFNQLHRASLILGLLIASQWVGCSQKQLETRPARGFKPTLATLNVGDSPEFETRIEGVTGGTANRLLVFYAKVDRKDGKKLGNFFKISRDHGSSFGPERKLPGGVKLIDGGLASVSTTVATGGNLFYQRSYDDGATWTEPAQINDEEGSVRWGWGGGYAFVQPTASDVYCLWTDRRRGFISLFFAASSDGGRTWGPNRAVEYDFREGEQSSPRLLIGADGRLIAIWVDWRDRKTLADIRSSYSDDRGGHWSASQKLNDDTEHVWQIAPAAVAQGAKAYVVFQDFREAGEEGDNDWNIYFARSDDNGASWTKNIRVNDIQLGVDGDAKLAIDEHGTLCAVWRSGRNSIFGEIAASQSTDGGRTWSTSAILNEGRELMRRDPENIVAPFRNKFLCLWRESGFDVSNVHWAWLEPFVEEATPAVSKESTPVAPPDAVSAPSPGGIIFADDFSGANEQRWQVDSGVWTIIEGTFMGVGTTLQSSFSSYPRIEEPERYIVNGRFKLDPVAHLNAELYFRWDPARERYYQVINQFRFGMWMGVRDADPTDPIAGRTLSSRPLVQKRFPFQNNRWYQFSLVVTPERVEYFVDGRLMLSYAEPLELPRSRFGIGGRTQSPTYFDDIVIAGQASR